MMSPTHSSKWWRQHPRKNNYNFDTARNKELVEQECGVWITLQDDFDKKSPKMTFHKAKGGK
jgi:hypothetical protein